MSYLKPKLVLGQTWLIIFLLLSISPASAQLRGDINLNYVPYEVADLVLFDRFLLYGDSVLVDPFFQGVSSDVNGDVICWTIGDLIHLERVIMEDADPIEGSTWTSSALSTMPFHLSRLTDIRTKDSRANFCLVSSSCDNSPKSDES